MSTNYAIRAQAYTVSPHLLMYQNIPVCDAIILRFKLVSINIYLCQHILKIGHGTAKNQTHALTKRPTHKHRKPLTIGNSTLFLAIIYFR